MGGGGGGGGNGTKTNVLFKLKSHRACFPSTIDRVFRLTLSWDIINRGLMQ